MPCGLSLVSRILSFLLLYPCSSKRLVTLARGLSPAFLRFGGKRTDFLQFQNLRNPAKSRGGPGPDYYLKNYEDGEKLGSHFCWVGKVWGVRGSNLCTCVCVCEGACRFGGGPGWSSPAKLVAVGEGTQECGSSEVIK